MSRLANSLYNASVFTTAALFSKPAPKPYPKTEKVLQKIKKKNTTQQ